MSEPFIAEIRIVGFNFAPRGWASCDGRLLPIAQNTALFSLLGTNYGGDGRTTFGLPNLSGRVPMHPGNGPGLSPHQLGELGGSETVALTNAQLPPHNHSAAVADTNATSTSPQSLLPATANNDTYQNRGSKTAATMSPPSIGATGGNVPHNNLQPSLAVNFVIALQGIYPSRS